MRTKQRVAYEAAYRKRNKEKLRKKSQDYYAKNRKKIIAAQAIYNRARRLRGYGITLEDEQRMIRDQGAACAICRGTEPKSHGGKSWHIDHCHVTNKVRSLLCQNCNLLLGHAKDSPVILKAAIKYLQKHKNRVKIKP